VCGAWCGAVQDESLWLSIGASVQRTCGVDVMLHLTCHLPVAHIKRILAKARYLCVRCRIALSLR
jgi:hypothetical protein